MTYLVEVPIDGANSDGANSFVMEVDGQLDRGVVRSARPDQVVATVAESFEAALERLQPLTRAIVVKLQDIVDGPERSASSSGSR